MSKIVRCTAVALALSVASVAIAQTAAEPAPAAAVALKSGVSLTSADGKRIGRIERIVKAADGSPVSASVIVDSRFVYVPASTLSASGNGFTTSLTRTEVRKLK
jgi:hypothetical protein